MTFSRFLGPPLIILVIGIGLQVVYSHKECFTIMVMMSCILPPPRFTCLSTIVIGIGLQILKYHQDSFTIMVRVMIICILPPVPPPTHPLLFVFTHYSDWYYIIGVQIVYYHEEMITIITLSTS